MKLQDWVRLYRQQRACSQVKLAHLSGVSLPTIQNIESGKANPSLMVVEKLLSVIGVELSFQPIPMDWELAAFLGAPLMNLVERHHTKPSAEKLREMLYQAASEFAFKQDHKQDHQRIGRKEEAIVACLLALQSHFPSFFAEFSRVKIFCDVMPKKISGRLLKLRRLALARLQSYL